MDTGRGLDLIDAASTVARLFPRWQWEFCLCTIYGHPPPRWGRESFKQTTKIFPNLVHSAVNSQKLLHGNITSLDKSYNAAGLSNELTFTYWISGARRRCKMDLTVTMKRSLWPLENRAGAGRALLTDWVIHASQYLTFSDPPLPPHLYLFCDNEFPFWKSSHVVPIHSESDSVIVNLFVFKGTSSDFEWTLQRWTLVIHVTDMR